MKRCVKICYFALDSTFDGFFSLVSMLFLRIIFFVALTTLCFWLDRSQVWMVFVLYSLLFGVYFYLFSTKIEALKTVKPWLYFAIGLRFLLLFSIPNLSDDFWRFLWDGHLWNLGKDAFAYQPSNYLRQMGAQIEPILKEIYPNLNSKEYFTIYPPVCQAVFGFATKFGGNSIQISVFLLKSFLFLCELGTIYLLYQPWEGMFFKRQHAAFVYAMNPLAIVEICGNVHFEGAAIFFLVLCLYFFEKFLFQVKNSEPEQLSKLTASVAALSLAIASKLIPLMYAPILLRATFPRFWPWFLGLLGIFIGFLFFPLFHIEAFEANQASIGLYFQSFEFNASIYYILRYFGTIYYGYNPIQMLGPLLGLCTLVLILFLFLKPRRRFFHNTSFVDVPKNLFIISFFYLICSTTIHPWYVLLPFLFSIFTKNNIILVWTYLVCLSYFRYEIGQKSDVSFIICIEYTILLLFSLPIANKFCKTATL